jgi:hypothetical protein
MILWTLCRLTNTYVNGRKHAERFDMTHNMTLDMTHGMTHDTFSTQSLN